MCMCVQVYTWRERGEMRGKGTEEKRVSANVQGVQGEELVNLDNGYKEFFVLLLQLQQNDNKR